MGPKYSTRKTVRHGTWGPVVIESGVRELVIPAGVNQGAGSGDKRGAGTHLSL